MSVVMPALEMAQETGKLLAWRKKEGERVSKGEPLLEIETDKAVVEVEAPGDGILAGITAQIGAVIPVGETIAWLVAPGEQPPTKATSTAPTARATSGAAPHAAAAAAAPVAARAAGVIPQISPKARRLAKELGVDFTQITGTGPEGVITAEDVQKFADSQGKVAAAAAPVPVPAAEPLSQVARLMAERTTQSWTSVPHFFLVCDVDASELIATQKKFSEAAEKSQSTTTTITDLLIVLIAK
ncbi:MAG TPA: E3 binding domain-containing protein, partial [Methylomirabilota bacterium]|nr:E3 binding domain-containing protein [Methylomirabilota bacterium]